jgi:hypothetical protein
MYYPVKNHSAGLQVLLPVRPYALSWLVHFPPKKKSRLPQSIEELL